MKCKWTKVHIDEITLAHTIANSGGSLAIMWFFVASAVGTPTLNFEE